MQQIQRVHRRHPRDIEFRTEVPKSSVGKVLRRELRDEGKKKAA